MVQGVRVRIGVLLCHTNIPSPTTSPTFSGGVPFPSFPRTTRGSSNLATFLFLILFFAIAKKWNRNTEHGGIPPHVQARAALHESIAGDGASAISGQDGASAVGGQESGGEDGKGHYRESCKL